MATSVKRRTLRFSDLDQISADAKKLLERGYFTAGKWNLSQVCSHCADWMGFAMDGYPRAPVPIRMMLWILCKTVGPKKLKQYLDDGDFPPGKPTMPQTVHDAQETPDAQAVRNLVHTIERFKRHTGPWHSSPLFGPMDGPTHRRLQLVHCSHHLSVLVPK